jgi:L-lactate dehydrogenase
MSENVIDKCIKEERNFTKKVSIIGMGYVGAGIAYALMVKDIAREIVFIDKREDSVNAEMLDIRHGMHNMGSAKIIHGSYEDVKDSDLIIITAGRNRKKGESRLDLIDDNIKIMDEVIIELKKYYNQGVILVVSNPVDIITYHVAKKMNLPKGRVLGTGCVLDTSRLINVISDYVNLGAEFINTMVIGEHGANQIPLWSSVKVAQMPIEKFCKEMQIPFNDNIKTRMEEKVRNMGSEIIDGKGRTYYGISTCVCYIADAILNRRSINVCVTGIWNGEYALNNVALSLPCLVDYTGIKHVLPVDISNSEYKQLIEANKKLSTILKNIYS